MREVGEENISRPSLDPSSWPSLEGKGEDEGEGMVVEGCKVRVR